MSQAKQERDCLIKLRTVKIESFVKERADMYLVSSVLSFPCVLDIMYLNHVKLIMFFSVALCVKGLKVRESAFQQFSTCIVRPAVLGFMHVFVKD